ncbi:MAG: AAA family ATPase [Chitinophagaceae bacterium]
MITRIKINGFKSLLQTELHFGPFTCIAGANAIGKSNFFDALSFLSQLADNTILHAAKSIRSENQRHSVISDIFFKSGSEHLSNMQFEVDMLVPRKAEDDLGQEALASITSLRYSLELKMNDESSGKEPIEIIKEELKPITLTDTRKSLLFEKSRTWVDSVVSGKKSTAFISTVGEKIKLHQDGSRGRTTEFIAEKMPRTLLSTVTSESPTAFLARQEMRNWTMLQFEPSALRQPNNIYEVKNAEITANGSNLPATLYRLNTERKEEDVYQKIANKVKGLVNDIKEIYVDKDEKRDLLTLQIKFRNDLTLPAQSLSDGTLRFLGLAIIQEDKKSSGLICLEEPENGINPKKVREMVELLEEMATDTEYEVNDENPLRQVIINTHSPLVVMTVADESLYLADEREYFSEELNKKVRHTGFSALKDTWKTDHQLAGVTSLGEIHHYLGEGDPTPSLRAHVAEKEVAYEKKKTKKRTVKDNVAEQLKLF